MTVDIAAFINARLDEEWQQAQAAIGLTLDLTGSDPRGRWNAEWIAGSQPPLGWQVVLATVRGLGRTIATKLGGGVAGHIARQSPAATLARVEALRALVALHKTTTGPHHPETGYKATVCDVCGPNEPYPDMWDGVDPWEPRLYPSATSPRSGGTMRTTTKGGDHDRRDRAAGRRRGARGDRRGRARGRRAASAEAVAHPDHAEPAGRRIRLDRARWGVARMNEISTTADGRALTLADLRAFLARCEAAGVGDAAEVRATVRLGGGVKRLTARDETPRGAKVGGS